MAFSDFSDKTRSGYALFRANTSAMGEFLKRILPDGFHIRKLGPEGLMSLKRDLVAARPVFEEAGFDLAAINLEMTLSPRLLAYFHILPNFNRDTAQAVMKEHSESRIVNTSLSALLRIASWETVASDYDMPLQTITIDVSLAPGVHLSFQDPPEEGEDPDLI
ncbi:MAG: hypothetical protein E2O92_07535 [Alphaproteobacteria bacterium]|nr:MAG: hypothetical protein E2O92_07535 [Alphaproteobacteria bacterium]